MQEERSAPGTRATITLQGGGRLAGVSRVLKVRLEAKDVEWAPVDERTLAVRGVIHSYIYFTRAGNRIIEGEGLSIPFSREIEALGLDLGHVDVEVEELVSDHDFDPMSADFQHRIMVILRVRPRLPAETEADHPSLVEAESVTDDAIDAIEDVPKILESGGDSGCGDRPEASDEAECSDSPESQERPDTDGEPAKDDEAESGDDPESGKVLEQRLGQTEEVLGAEAAGESRFSQVRSGPSPSDDPEGQVIEVPPPPSAKPGGEGKGVLVWKPFPPPIDS